MFSSFKVSLCYITTDMLQCSISLLHCVLCYWYWVTFHWYFVTFRCSFLPLLSSLIMSRKMSLHKHPVPRCPCVHLCVYVLCLCWCRAKPSFQREAPLMQRWPRPWPSPPWIWQELIYLIFHPACAHTHIHTFIRTFFRPRSICPTFPRSCLCTGEAVHYSLRANTHRHTYRVGRPYGSDVCTASWV